MELYCTKPVLMNSCAIKRSCNIRTSSLVTWKTQNTTSLNIIQTIFKQKFHWFKQKTELEEKDRDIRYVKKPPWLDRGIWCTLAGGYLQYIVRGGPRLTTPKPRKSHSQHCQLRHSRHREAEAALYHTPGGERLKTRHSAQHLLLCSIPDTSNCAHIQLCSTQDTPTRVLHLTPSSVHYTRHLHLHLTCVKLSELIRSTFKAPKLQEANNLTQPNLT